MKLSTPPTFNPAALRAAFMRPGMRLMRRLRLPFKMGLLGAMLLPPMVLLLASGLSDARSGLATARAEQAGAALMRQVTELALQVQIHRTLSNQVAAGNANLTPQRDATRLRLRQAVAQIDAMLQRPQPFELADAWRPERERLLALAQGRYPERRAEARAEHGERVEALQRFAFLIGERSELLFDPQASTFFLMDLGVERVIPWMEALSQTDALGVELLGREPSAAERDRMLHLATAAERAGEAVLQRLQALERSGVQSPGAATGAREAAGGLVALTRKTFDAEAVQAEAASFHAAGAQALAAAARLDDEVWEQFDDLLARRVERFWQAMLLQSVAAVAGILGMAYLAFSFYWSFSGALGVVIRSVLAVARGDLSQPVRIEGSDELAEVGGHLERMSERLSTLVGEIRSSAVRVDQAGFTVAEDGRALSQRTEEQAGSLRQTVVTVQQLSAAVGTNAEAAAALQGLTDGLRDNAAAGHEVMAGTVQAMGTLEDSVRRVAEINAVIDDIAFQTNLLALNASVEAAHAGESGKGFAVVASAIRQLASRTGEAAAEVRTLIESTTEQASRSVLCIGEAGTHLDSIVAGVAEVSQRLNLIAGASAEQSRALVEVTASVGSLDDITQHNAAMVAKSTGAAQALADQAASLRASVATIQLRSGSADEARGLVERAVAHIAEVGWDRAAAAFNDPVGDFVDRDMYVFGLDAEGRYLVCGARPACVGTLLYDLTSVPFEVADAFMRAAALATSRHAGWIDYRAADWCSGELISKSAYVCALDDGAFLGCGIHRRDLAAAASSHAAANPVAPVGQSTVAGGGGQTVPA